MPLVASVYQAPWALRSGHLQTILPLCLPRRYARWQTSERLELPDGDFVDLHWQRGGFGRLVILSHGLEGSSEAVYIRGMAATLSRAGWDVLAWNYRGCGGVANRLPRSYHSGESEDLRHVIVHAGQGYSRMALVGFSLGGNITLKYLGEATAHPAITSAVAVSAPVDLASSAGALDSRRDNGLYLRRFLKTLITKMEAKARQFPDHVAVEGIRRIRTIREFDDRYTAPLHGFRDAEDYWARASSLPHLPKIQVPALLLNAQDDPLLAASSFPEGAAGASSFLHLETPRHGGHVGFLDFAQGLIPWHERRAVQFLNGGDDDPAAPGMHASS
ncbi:MAG: alpha/beta fold hydrolase [Prosthecobacter sp.]|nr:alpha/beta fold hydrolase [Prosthecobacter sp.]